MDALEASGQMDNTLIVFTSDHGELLGDYQCYGKRSMHNSAAKIPMLVYQKGVFEGGKTVDTPVSLVDLAPTFLETAGLDPIQWDMDGKSILSEKHDYVYSIFSCYQEALHGSVKYIPDELKKDQKLLKAAFGNYMITDGKWKYIYSAPDGREFLFDLEHDRETRNRAGVASCMEIQKKLKGVLISYLEKEGFGCLIRDGEWIPMPKMELPDNPDSALIVQDITCDWYDETLPGYQ